MIIDSGGARASKDQLKQLSAIKGLVVDPLGKIVELPTKSNYREGLSIFEYVTSTRGSRKGLTDSALKTADAGYLTRRLVDVSHDAIIHHEDCGTTEGWEISRSEERQAAFSTRLIGRTVTEDVLIPDSKKVLFTKGEEITEEKARLLDVHGVASVFIRSPLTCRARVGLCIKCYGYDFSTGKIVDPGTPVGVIAAQSIGEPGTQLTMRVRHAGGIVGLDVTQGLPRVEELFEARIPRVLSPLSEISGKAEVTETENGYKIVIRNTQMKPAEEREYLIPLTSELRVKDGDLVGAGHQIASGSLDLKEVLQVRGLRGAQRYLIIEIQRVYESQGIPINDKHFEVIVRRMSEKYASSHLVILCYFRVNWSKKQSLKKKMHEFLQKAESLRQPRSLSLVSPEHLSLPNHGFLLHRFRKRPMCLRMLHLQAKKTDCLASKKTL